MNPYANLSTSQLFSMFNRTQDAQRKRAIKSELKRRGYLHSF